MNRHTVTVQERRGTIAYVFVDDTRVGLVALGEIPDGDRGALGWYAVAYDGTRKPPGSFVYATGSHNTTEWGRKRAARWLAQHYLTHRAAA